MAVNLAEVFLKHRNGLFIDIKPENDTQFVKH